MNTQAIFTGDRQSFGGFLRARIAERGRSMPDAAARDASPERLWREGQVEASELAEALAAFHGMPRASFDAVSACAPVSEGLSRRYLRDGFVFPFAGTDGTALAVADPGRAEVIQAVRLALGAPAPVVVVSFEEIDRLFERAAQRPADEVTGIVPPADDPAAPSRETAESLQDLAKGAPVVRLVDQILERALELGATDIHLETERDGMRVRYRVDGILRRDQKLPLHLAQAVISRVKILAALDIADRRLPQDGRANLKVGTAEADLRVAVMPTMYGETAVLRILVRDNRLLELGRIGMREADQRAFEALLAQPHGILVVTGPTGSGKTTTLATAISMLNDPSRKIVTVEDPVEYQIAGVHQTQIKPSIGLTFASALRSFLRHDPDIIMVGEMRDRETAGVGIQAALTGHLVLTTLHTNSAGDAIVRLVDMGIEPYLLAASLRGVLGQRLVRKLCDRCKREDERSAEQARAIARRHGIELVQGQRFFAPAGCDACGHSGYRGRVGIFEVMPVGEPLRKAIRDKPDVMVLRDLARGEGMTLMMEDGFAKCGRGLTSVEEVVRATG